MADATIAAKYIAVPRNTWDGTEKIPIDVGGADGVGLASTLKTYIGAGSGAGLGANTFTDLQTIAQASANAGVLASTGYSLTGSNATGMVSLAGTLNTTGVVDVLKLSITNTASGAGTNLLNMLVGGSSIFAVDIKGDIHVGGLNGNGGPVFAIDMGSGFMKVAGGSSRASNNALYYDYIIQNETKFMLNTQMLLAWGATQGATAASQIASNLGSIIIGAAAIAANATDGFLYIPTCAGTPTGVPTAKTGRVPMVYDTTNHQFWFYDGSWLQPKTPGAAAIVNWQ